MASDSRIGTLGAGAVLTAIGASACCVLPLVMGSLGLGSLALAARLEPFRPLFILLTALLLGFGFYQAYRQRTCRPGEACALPANRTRQRVILWAIAFLSALVLGFPYYAVFLF